MELLHLIASSLLDLRGKERAAQHKVQVKPSAQEELAELQGEWELQSAACWHLLAISFCSNLNLPWTSMGHDDRPIQYN